VKTSEMSRDQAAFRSPEAETALGTKFSMEEFHNVVLSGGSMSLDVLAQ